MRQVIVIRGTGSKSMYHIYRRLLSALLLGLLLLCFMSPMQSTAQTEASMYSTISQSLALIVAKNGKRVGTGTGFCIGSHDGTAYLLTNRHVVDTDSSPAVILQSDPSSILTGHVVRLSTLDAAVIAVDSASCRALTLSSTNPAVGTRVAIAGFPAFQLALSNGDFRNLSPSFHDGTVSGAARSGDLIEYDAQTDRGNSGSPLFDLQTGAVYGIATLVNTGTTGALQNNLAVSIPALQTFLDNAHANVAFYNQGTSAESAGPKSTPAPAAIAIDTRCGQGTSAGLTQTVSKAYAELNANDYVTASADARLATEAASVCAVSFFPNCQPESPCDDSKHEMLEASQLMSQQILRIATARMHGDWVNAERNEVSTMVDLCNSPNIQMDAQPYRLSRGLITNSIQLVQKTYRSRELRGVIDIDAVRSCASKIGLSF